MKKPIIILWAAMLISSATVSGQFIDGVGLKGGLSLSNTSHEFTPLEYTIETQPVIGPALAAFVEVLQGEHLSLQLDAAYASRGSKTRVESITVDHMNNDRIMVNEGEEQVSNFTYLSFSPMARFRAQKGSITPYVLLGPRVDLLLKYETDSPYPLDDQNDMILGLTGAVGLEYSLSMLAVFAELQYQPDLSPVTNTEPLLVNNNALSLLLGVRF
jgi:hypothetical protein